MELFVPSFCVVIFLPFSFVFFFFPPLYLSCFFYLEKQKSHQYVEALPKQTTKQSNTQAMKVLFIYFKISSDFASVNTRNHEIGKLRRLFFAWWIQNQLKFVCGWAEWKGVWAPLWVQLCSCYSMEKSPWCLEGLRPQGTPKLRGRFLVLSGAPYKSWDCTARKMLPFSWGHLK